MIERIENIKKLAEALESKEFYDFHDAEIVSLKFDRKSSVTLEVVLQIKLRIAEFEQDGKVFERFRNFDATFSFSKVWLLSLNRFGHQNVINELKIERSEEIFIVHFVEIYGCDLKFECEKMKFSGVEIYETENVKFIPDIEKSRDAVLAARKSGNK